MLLFSTLLNIKESITKDQFIKLVLKWNENNPYEVNIIPGIVWNGETDIRYGSETLWMEIKEYQTENIIAVRYEKIEEDGIKWDTDYIMNFNEMKLSILLDRSYAEDALRFDPSFSTPRFITHLIDEGFLKDDEGLPIYREPVIINKENTHILTDLINYHKAYDLPVVYISKTQDNTDPVDVSMLAERLKGIAHVLLQEDYDLNPAIGESCDNVNEYNGAIGIYYPNLSRGNERILYRKHSGYGKVMFEQTVKRVVQYSNSKSLDNMYTWQGVTNAILLDNLTGQIARRMEAEKARKDAEKAKTEAEEARTEAEDARIKAEEETEKIFDTFDEDLEKLKKQVESLTKENDALRNENYGIRAKLNNLDQVPVLIQGQETDIYSGEIREIILDELEALLANLPDKSRRADVIRDIIDNNEYQHKTEEREQQIKNLFKDYRTLSGPARQELMDLGFEITEDGKHYKLIYGGDDRYWTTIAKTASDHRSGKNTAAEIIKGMF